MASRKGCHALPQRSRMEASWDANLSHGAIRRARKQSLMNAIPAPNDENRQDEPPMGNVNEPQPRRDESAFTMPYERDPYTLEDDYDDEYDDDEYDDDDEYSLEDYIDDVDSSDYTAGYQDGYTAGMRANALRYRLKAFFFPYSVRSKYYALRRRLFP